MSETRTMRLGDIARWGSGGTPKRSVSEYFGGNIPWLSISDLNDGTVSVSKENITEAGLANSSAKLVPAGSVLVAMYGSIGKLGIAGVDLATSQAIAFAVPDESVILAQYLFYKLLELRPRLISMGRGGTQQNIGQADLKGIEIELPPIIEQRRQIEIWNLQTIISQKRERQQELYTELERSLFISIFGNPENWANKFEMTTIGDLSESTQYGTSAKAGTTGEYPVLRMGNITDDGKLDLSDLKYMDLSPEEVEKYTVRKGDLLFNRTNSKEKVGKAAVVLTDEKLAYAGYLVRVRFKNPDHAHFVAAFLNSDYGRKLRRKLAKTAVNQANINAKELCKISIKKLAINDSNSFIFILKNLNLGGY